MKMKVNYNILTAKGLRSLMDTAIEMRYDIGEVHNREEVIEWFETLPVGEQQNIWDNFWGK